MKKKQATGRAGRRQRLFLCGPVRVLAEEAGVVIPHKCLLRRGEVRELLGISSDKVTTLVADGILKVV